MAGDKKQFSTPEPPKAPDKPKTMRERHAERADWYRPVAPYVPRPSAAPFEPPNLKRKPIERGEGHHQASFRVLTLKHGHSQPSVFYVTFESLENARSFKIEYWITAANVPNEVRGYLHVIVNREAGEARQEGLLGVGSSD